MTFKENLLVISKSRIHSLKQVTQRIALLAFIALLLPALRAQTLLDVPKVADYASDHGPSKLEKSVTITVHLKLRDQAGFDKAVEELYEVSSPKFHHWLTPAQIASYGATDEDFALVKKELELHGLTTEEADRENAAIRAHGTIAQLESAFQTTVHDFEREGHFFHSNVTPASLTGAAGSLIKSVSGLSTLPLKSHIAVVKDPKTGKARPFVSVKKGTNPVLSNLFTNVCFSSAQALQLTTQGSISLPQATYFGNVYGAASLPCGWTPAQLQNYYGLQQAYQAGYQGDGQTIVLVDGPAYGSQIASDFANFSQWTGSPAPTKTSFQIIYPDGVPAPYEMEYLSDWTEEADLDVQWAHALAPKAKIVLLILPTEDWSELEYGIQYAVTHKLGNVISNSYGYPEFLWGRHTVQGFEQTLETAAAAGVTVNFSSGDSGDEGTGGPNLGGASYPATSAYATAVGGTSIDLLNIDGTTSDTGWGTNQNSYLAIAGNPEPPGVGLYVFGSGGGESTLINKPKWQKALSGNGRQEPDISDIADPYTGVVIVYNGQLGVIGGTSAASPVFSAIWSLASEKAKAPLGQAAPLFANLPTGAINDVLPVSSPDDVVGFYITASGATYWSAAELAAPLENTTQFYSALWDEYGNNSGVWVVQTFGTDSSLTVAPGWDNVTGWGSPNGYTFISDVAATVTPKK
jgi:subtilase family serine protease